MSLDNDNNSNVKKRKADVLGRLSQSSAASSGRGATAGWTLCPFCGDSQKKKFAAGRGIAAHLHAVHTPWTQVAGKAAKRKKRRIEQRRLAEACRSTKKNDDDLSTDETTMPTTSQPSNSATAADDDAGWTPTEKEVDEWNETVLKIITQLEQETVSSDVKNSQNIKPAATTVGLDRNGSTAQDYRNSLPEFLQAAANADLLSLERMCDEASARAGNDSLRALLYTRDRHGSTAEHWAAGSGHLKCLQWIIAKQLEHPIMPAETPAKVRRRDGKTALHYAARNGHLHCIQFLVESCAYQVNAASGDGTTPFHLACFGAHLTVAQYLIQQGGNARACNEWKCSAVHWVAMTKNESMEEVIRFCEFLKTDLGLSFAAIQKQGHSALHKAAQVS